MEVGLEPTGNPEKTVLVFEPEYRGHHAEYVDHLLRALKVRPDWKVVLAGPWMLREILKAERNIDPLEYTDEIIDLRLSKGSAGGIRHRVLYPFLLRKAFGEACRSSGAGAAVIMQVDPVVIPWIVRGGPLIPTAGILFRPPSLDRAKGDVFFRARRWAKATLLRILIRRRSKVFLYSLDPRLVRDPGFAAVDRVRPLLDPVPVARKSFQGTTSSNGSVRFLLFGALSIRKGLLETIAAADILSREFGNRIQVRICGQPDSAVRDYLVNSDHNIKRMQKDGVLHLDLRRLPPDELVVEVDRADVILVPYRQVSGSSGVLGWAAAAGKPVIAQDGELIGALTREYGLGVAVATDSAPALAAAMRLFLEGKPHDFFDPEGQERFCRERSPENFGKTLSEFLDHR